MEKRYSVTYTEHAIRQIRKLDKHTQVMLQKWINKNLIGCTDPRAHGKGLTANRAGQWRYRIGDYRLICDIQDERIQILVLEAGHRRDVYD